MFEYDVFLSYSSEDKDIVHALAKRLKQDGLRVWFDNWIIQPRDLAPLKIQEGVVKSSTCILCMSPAYFESEWRKMKHYTLPFRDPTNEQRRLIPLLITDCTLPDNIAKLTYIDWRTSSDESYDMILAFCQEKKEAKNYGDYLADIGCQKEAEEQYKLTLAANLNPAATHCNYGNLLYDMGRQKEAEEQYKLALASNPNYADTHYNYGNLLYDMGRQTEAEEQYILALVSNPNHADTHYNYGLLLEDMGCQMEAEEQYMLALVANPDDADTHHIYGLLLEEMGRQKEAEEHYMLALATNPNDEAIRHNYGLLLEDMGRQKEAEEQYKLAGGRS